MDKRQIKNKVTVKYYDMSDSHYMFVARANLTEEEDSWRIKMLAINRDIGKRKLRAEAVKFFRS